MKRIIAIVAAVVVVAPSAALANRSATGSTRRAIEQVTHLRLPGEPQGCVFISVTTKDGGNWATAHTGADTPACKHWIANGYALVHRVRGRWREVGGGDGPVPCRKLGVPTAVRRDLGLSCGAPI